MPTLLMAVVGLMTCAVFALCLNIYDRIKGDSDV